MQCVAFSSTVGFKPTIRTFSHRLTIQCVASPFSAAAAATNTTNPHLSATAPSTTNNFTSSDIRKSRANWQSSCAMLASKVRSQQWNTDKSSGADKLSVVNRVNRHSSLDLVLVNKQPKPLTIADLSPVPTHGSTVRVAYQGVPCAYSEAAAETAYPNRDAFPCD
ncbi:hypothetical protein R6Q59_033476 [Mikania micrantha]